MDVLQSMLVFRRVAEVGSFSAVARESGLSQPTVSKHVAALEQRLGAKLISRSTRQLTLTEAGSEYLDRCSRILDELAETEANLSDQQSQLRGTLRVDIPITFGRRQILPLLWPFLSRYPELKIDLTMEDRHVDLIKEGVDVAIRSGVLADSALISNKIGEVPRTMVASPGYLANRREPRSLSDLKQHDCIVYTVPTPRNEWHFTGPKNKEKVRVRGRISVNNQDAVREAILANLGIAVIPRWLVSDCIEDGRMQEILTDYKPTPFELHAVFPARQFVPKKVRLFIDFVRENINL